MIEIELNGARVQATEGETLLAVCRRNKVDIPTLCHLADLAPSGACRMCVVEVDGQRGLVPSCAFAAAPGLKVRTHTPRVLRARKAILELLLAGHPQDCLHCGANASCELREMAARHHVTRRRFFGEAPRAKLDLSSPSLARDPAKCVLCGRCVRVCEEVQGVSAIDFIGRGSQARVGAAFDEGLNASSCVNCGQCVTVCPTGALRAQDHLERVLGALGRGLHVVAQHAPAVSVTLGEEFALPPGADVAGRLNAALRRAGFARVFDTGFSADLTIMEEGSELVERIRKGGVLPMLTSCSPGWIKYVEQFLPRFIPNLSTCKSPQQMLGALAKTHYARLAGLDPARVYSVSIMPCTAKKFEAARTGMGRDGLVDVDAVLTTRECADLLRLLGMDLAGLEGEAPDDVFGERSTAGKLFGASGGVMEAALRSAHFLLTGRNPAEPVVKELRQDGGVKEARVRIGELELGVAVASGLANAKRLLEQVAAGRDDLHFIEVMTCPGGCIGGGGQPKGADPAALKARLAALYALDRDGSLRFSHENASVKRLYAEFLGEPLSARSHELLHTRYEARTPVM